MRKNEEAKNFLKRAKRKEGRQKQRQNSPDKLFINTTTKQTFTTNYYTYYYY